MQVKKLSPRLRAVADQVPRGAKFADIGTDHALLPLWLLREGIIEHAIATDVREGPLGKAKKTLSEGGCLGSVSLRLCDGLSGLSPDEADTIAIAGMGGETIAKIMLDTKWASEGTRLFLLQPMSAAPDLRLWLSERGFAIRRETVVEERRRLYITMAVIPGEMPPLSPAEQWAGRQWESMDCPLRDEYLKATLRRAKKALFGASLSSRTEDAPRRAVLEQAVEGLTEMREEWRQWQRQRRFSRR